MRDFGREAQAAAEMHLEACELSLMGEDEEPIEVDVDMAGPYCGCTTCVVRETLHAAWPILIEAARAEL